MTNGDDNTVSVISDSSNIPIATVSVGENPLSVIYDFHINEAFVKNSDSISVLSGFAASTFPTPIVPEFGNSIGLVFMLATAVTFLSVVYLLSTKSFKITSKSE